MLVSLVLAFLGFAKGIAWPTLAAAAVWLFRREIRTALDGLARRATKIGPGGVELAPPAEQQVQGDGQLAKAGELEGISIDLQQAPAVRSIATGLREKLALIPESSRVELLIVALAQTRLERGHERVYRMIFGTQIAALFELNKIRRTTRTAARAFFEQRTVGWREHYEGYGFEGWLGFLVNNQLVKAEGDELEITEFGEDFLLYFIRNRLPEKAL